MVKKLGTHKPTMFSSERPAVAPPLADAEGPLDRWPALVSCPRCKQENSSTVESCSHCGFSFHETHAIAGPALAATGNRVGQVINGKYRVLSVLGEGGFGVVYRVELLLFDTANIFALKLLHPALSQDKSFRRRFLREAGLAMALIHENTIQIREFGQTEEGDLFFTMDYSEGEPLNAVIGREHFLNVNRSLHVTRQVLSVMKLAHSRGIIHRDLKPENIFLERDTFGRDFIKVGDFGLAKSFVTGDESNPLAKREDITRGGIVGTPRYMSPEQAMGKEDLDGRSDLYSTGLILYEMLFGQVPQERASLGGPDSGSLKTPPSNPGHAIPKAVWETVRKSLEIRREDRYQSAAEFLGAIDALPHYTPTYIVPMADKPWPWRRWRAAAATTAVLAALAGGGLFLGGLLRGPTSDPGHALRVALPVHPDNSVDAASRDVGGSAPERDPQEKAGEASEAGVYSPSLSPFPSAGVRAYLRYQKGDVLRYQTYREGMVPEREIVYTIEDEPSPGRFIVKVSPGDRKVSWVVDGREQEITQEFQLPNAETGELTEPARRLWLRLPRPEAVVDGDYPYADFLVHAKRVDLNLPRNHPQYDRFEDCLRVESREESRLHYHFYQEGRGLVGIEVYELREAAPAGEPAAPAGGLGTAEAAPAGTDPSTPTVKSAADAPDAPGQPRRVLIFARYLIEHQRAPAEAAAGAAGVAAPPQER